MFRKIIFIDYLLMKRGINMDEKIALGTHSNWFKPNNYKRYAIEEMSLLSHENLLKNSTRYQWAYVIQIR